MWYFAYGSNMDPAQLARRKVAFSNPRVAVLENHQLTFNKVATLNAVPGEGRANIVPMPGRRVEGVAFTVPEGSLVTLDEYEGARTGHYRRTPVGIVANGQALEAITYVAVLTDVSLTPSGWYRNTIVRGAKHFGLSTAYISELEALATVGPTETPKERV